MKTCLECEAEKPLTDFYKDKRRRDGHGIYCKPCWALKYASSDKHKLAARLAMKRYWDAKSGTPEFKKQRRTNQLKYLYKLTQADYDQMLESQNNSCAICFSQFTESRLPMVDHDHKCCSGHRSCGKCVRGLLCRSCNHFIGQCNEDIDTLQSAINYLRSE